jgi:hypothetical protein
VAHAAQPAVERQRGASRRRRRRCCRRPVAPCTFAQRSHHTPTHPPRQQNIPVADAKPDDIKDLLGGALFKALFKWFTESGPVYLLPTGPVSSFLVISDPDAAKHVLRATDNSTRWVWRSVGRSVGVEAAAFGCS